MKNGMELIATLNFSWEDHGLIILCIGSDMIKDNQNPTWMLSICSSTSFMDILPLNTAATVR